MSTGNGLDAPTLLDVSVNSGLLVIHCTLMDKQHNIYYTGVVYFGNSLIYRCIVVNLVRKRLLSTKNCRVVSHGTDS